jgi:hypothetical protein
MMKGELNRRVISAPVAPNNILRRKRSGLLSSAFTTDDIVSRRPLPARSFVPQHDVLTSVSTYKVGFPYTANHPKRVLITYVKRIKGTDAFMISGVLK